MVIVRGRVTGDRRIVGLVRVDVDVYKLLVVRVGDRLVQQTSEAVTEEQLVVHFLRIETYNTQISENAKHVTKEASFGAVTVR